MLQGIVIVVTAQLHAILKRYGVSVLNTNLKCTNLKRGFQVVIYRTCDPNHFQHMNEGRGIDYFMCLATRGQTCCRAEKSFSIHTFRTSVIGLQFNKK